MPLIDTLEKKLGHLAIPHSVRILALFQAVTWLMIKMQPPFADWISLDRDKVLHGEVWRLVTWAFDPGNIGPIWILFAIMIMFTMGDGLEQAWGTFRVNLYVLGGILAMDIGTMIFGFNPVGLTLYSTIFLAFAVFYPNFEFLLFFVLPVKVKYLAWLNGALLLLVFIGSPAQRLPVLFSVLNFLVAFGPGFIRGAKHGAVVAQRKSRFDAARTSESAAFHQCASCKKTELDDKNLDFRVTADGEEYCTVCRPRTKA
jgi:membrane associated rhomboid family serine protease